MKRKTLSTRTRALFQPLESRLLFSAGDLDPTFGEGGISVLDGNDHSFGENTADFVVDAAAGPDDSLVLLVDGWRRDRYDPAERHNVIERSFGITQVGASGAMSTDLTSD